MDPEVHSQYGGSKADRWMNCAGSVALCATVPPLPSSAYAAEGTRAHSLGEFCLKGGYDSAAKGAADLPDVFGPSIEMCDAVQVYLDAVYAEMAKAPDAELYVEQKFVFPGMDGEVYGSNDALVYTPSLKRLAVFDYKHGVGVSVGADNNAQLKFYATGALLANPSWSVSEIELIIVQPRARDVDEVGAVKPWPMDIVEILNFSAEVEDAVAKARHAITVFENYCRLHGPTMGFMDSLKVGPWCRWCDAAAICPAREREALKAMGGYFSSVKEIDVTGLPGADEMTPARISEILAGIDVLQGWAMQVREFAEAHMLAGTMEIPNWKVVDKIGRSRWIDADEEIAGYLSMLYDLDPDDVRPRKLATIGVIEKLLKSAGAKKDDVEAVKAKYTIKESSGFTIAPAHDRRPAVSPNANHFDGVKVD